MDYFLPLPWTGEGRGEGEGQKKRELDHRAINRITKCMNDPITLLVSLGLFMQIGVTGKGTEYILTRHKDAIRPIYLSPLAGEPACRSLGEGRGGG